MILRKSRLYGPKLNVLITISKIYIINQTVCELLITKIILKAVKG